MRNFLARLICNARYDLRLGVVKGLPSATGLMAVIVALAMAERAWATALYFCAFMLVFILARWLASDEKRWNRHMAWLPDELKGKQ